MGTLFRPILHPCSRPGLFSALGLTCSAGISTATGHPNSAIGEATCRACEIYKVSCVREHAFLPGAAPSSCLVSDILCWSWPRTGELAKGSVAAQAKARSTLETDELHKPVATRTARHDQQTSPLACREQASSSDSRLRITARCYPGPGCFRGKSGRLFWVASSREGFTCWPLPASACVYVPDCC
jgi:hypothetical protein